LPQTAIHTLRITELAERWPASWGFTEPLPKRAGRVGTNLLAVSSNRVFAQNQAYKEAQGRPADIKRKVAIYTSISKTYPIAPFLGVLRYFGVSNTIPSRSPRRQRTRHGRDECPLSKVNSNVSGKATAAGTDRQAPELVKSCSAQEMTDDARLTMIFTSRETRERCATRRSLIVAVFAFDASFEPE